jgi:hypothetical protein
MDWTAKILKIDNSNIDRVDFWISLNADKSSSFVASLPALETDKTVSDLALWAYQQWLKKQSPTQTQENS